MSEENFIKEDEAARLEEWRPIVGYEGKYWVSDKGRVKNKDGRLMLQHLTNSGYPAIRLYSKGNENRKCIHRLIAEAFILNPDNLKTVNHKDLNKTNNNLENLEWMSIRQNVQHYYDFLRQDPETFAAKYINRRKSKKFKTAKKVFCFDFNRNFIQEFPSPKTAAEFYGLSQNKMYEFLDKVGYNKYGVIFLTINNEPEYYI